MEAIIEGLAQYGPLGLWTASLLWMNWQQRKDAEADEQRAAEAPVRTKVRQKKKKNIVIKKQTKWDRFRTWLNTELWRF